MDDVILLDEHLESYNVEITENIKKTNGMYDKNVTTIKNQSGVFGTITNNEIKMFPQGVIDFDTIKLHTKNAISKGSEVIRVSTGLKYYIYANKNYGSIADLKTYILNRVDDNE